MYDINYMRNKRDLLLIASDWTQANDSPLSDTMKAAWATYRQELRDITSDPAFPVVEFPNIPVEEVAEETPVEE